MSTSYPDRDIRQRELVPPQKLANIHAVVVGVGAVGRQVAMQLAATGVPAMTLVDHDRVAVENLAVQGYWPQDLELPKVEATGRLSRCIYPEILIDLQCRAISAIVGPTTGIAPRRGTAIGAVLLRRFDRRTKTDLGIGEIAPSLLRRWSDECGGDQGPGQQQARGR